MFYNKNMSAVRPLPKGLVSFSKQAPRKALFDIPDENEGPVTYADRSTMGVDNKLVLKKGNHGMNWCQFEKSSPRDNQMYQISEGFNL